MLLISRFISNSVVMPGFRPGIHEFAAQKLVDARAKPGHDDRVRDGAEQSTATAHANF